MENNISFTSFIKNEIMEYNWTDKQWGILFYSFIRTNGTFKNSKYIITTTLLNWEEKINELFYDYYNLKILPSKTIKLLKYEISDPEFLEKFSKELGNMILSTLDSQKAYLAGVFLGKGWINSPNSRFYHCELRVRHLSHSLDVQEAFDSFGVRTVTVEKNGWFYTYIKKSSDISTTIKAFNASQSVMIFEDSRIERDFLATYKKMESIEKHNLEKTKISSVKQIKAIDNVFENNLDKMLTLNQKNLAELRKSNPEYSLFELQMEFNSKYNLNVSRSTINVWMKKIIDLSSYNN